MRVQRFQFKVKDQEYSGHLNQFTEITSQGKLQSNEEFVIEKNGKYFFTLGLGNGWSWIIKDKAPISIEENLVQQIGKAAHTEYFKSNNIDVSLYRGAYEINNMYINKVDSLS